MDNIDKKWLLALICAELMSMVLALCFIVDSFDKLNENLSIRNNREVFYHLDCLKVDTLHAEEIEIFPLCDLQGNVVE